MELIEELKKRHVFRVAAFYVGVAWIVLQLAEITFPAFEVPNWVFRALIGVLVVGFFVSVVIAWLYEFTSEGLKREEDVRRGKFKPLFVGRPMDFVVIGILAVALGISLYGNIVSQPVPAESVTREPVSVLVADFDNKTNDPVFQGALEQALTIGLEGASFITSFARPAAMKIASQLDAEAATLNAEIARLVSVREGIKVVLTGAIEPKDGGYFMVVRAVDPPEGQTVSEATAWAGSKAEVLTAVGSLAGQIREALGDESLENGELAAGESFTAASIEAASDYTTAQELARTGKDGEAIEYYERAVAADPEFARAYSGWGLSAFKLGRRNEAAEKWQQALALLDRMTERERYRTLGLYYTVVSLNYDKAIENYEQLVKLYPADGAGHNNLSVLYFLTLQFDKAVAESGRLLEIYPRSVLYRANHALNAMWAGDMEQAATEAAKVVEEDPSYFKAYLVLAMDALSKPDVPAAEQAYARMAATGPRGASLAAAGRADIALFEGRPADAEQILLEGLAADREAGDERGVGTKTIALAQAYLAQDKGPAALGALEQLSRDRLAEGQLIPAAEIYVALERPESAQAIAEQLRNQLRPQARAYAKLIEAMIAQKDGRYIEAIDALKGAVGLADLWIVRFYLGQAYLAAGYPAEARSEFDGCANRRSEAMAMFFDDVPTWRYTAELPQWIARATKALIESANAPGAAGQGQ